jgi:Na+/H+-dicarboxylate symporter
MRKIRIALHWQIIIALLLGILWSVLSSKMGEDWVKFTMNWIDPFGKIFISLLKLIAVPLVLFSVIKGISDISDSTRLGRLGLKTLVTYLVTTVIAVGLGLALVNIIKPGNLVSEDQRITNRIAYELWVEKTKGVEYQEGDHVKLHKDPKYAKYLGKAEAVLEETEANDDVNAKLEIAKKTEDEGPLQFVVDMVPQNVFYAINAEDGKSKMLQVIFFAIFFGIVLIQIPKTKAEPVIKFVDGMNEVFLKMVDIIMKAAPFFVFALLAGLMVKMTGGDLKKMEEIFKALGWYSITVLLGLVLMIFVFYPMVMILLVSKKLGMKPLQAYKYFFKGISPAQFLAFSTSSSAATLPVTLDCVTENLKVPKPIANFVLPIGATVNMDGTSLYQAVAVIFLAQFHMIDLDIAQQMTIVLTATLASIGSAAVPSAGLIMLIVVLQSVGLNPAWIAIILPIDRILDMCRTVVNVTGDATVATIIAQSEGELNLKKEPVPEQ